MIKCNVFKRDVEFYKFANITLEKIKISKLNDLCKKEIFIKFLNIEYILIVAHQNGKFS